MEAPAIVEFESLSRDYIAFVVPLRGLMHAVKSRFT